MRGHCWCSWHRKGHYWDRKDIQTLQYGVCMAFELPDEGDPATDGVTASGGGVNGR